MTDSSRARLKALLRWLVAAILLVWLFRSGKLSSLRDLDRLISAPGVFSFVCVFLSLNYILNFFRWKTLLSGVGIDVPLRQVIRLSMIGQFFSIFMPGSVGGDLIKALYVSRSFPQQRTNGVASILLDRILGFLTLMAFASFFFVLSFDAAHLPPALQGFGTLLAFGTGTLLLMVMAPARAVSLLEKLNIQNALIFRMSKTLKAFARKPSTLAKGLFLSALSQGCAIFGMFLIGQIVYGALPWGAFDLKRFVSAVAVGTTASALPLSPMGLGVGQIAFGKTFLLLGAPDEAHGIIIISAVQVITFVFNLSGALWFLKSKKEIRQLVN